MKTKDYLISFWVSILISVFLFYRNSNYDRVAVSFIVFLGFANLILYGYHSNANNHQSLKWLLVCFALQCCFLSLSIYFSVTGLLQTISGYLFVFSGIILTAMIFYVNSNNKFSIYNNRPLVNGKDLNQLLKYGYIILTTILLSILSCHHHWKNVSLNLFIIFFLISSAYSFSNYLLIFPNFSALFCLLTWGSTIADFHSTKN